MESQNNIAIMVSLSGKKIDQYTYIKRYVYSLNNEKFLEPKKTEKCVSGNNWNDLYYLFPGQYLIIETNVEDAKHNCGYKYLKVFTREEYLYNKKELFPDADINAFKKLYQYGGWEITEWTGNIPKWIDLPCVCLYTKEEKVEKDEKREEYKQPQEVEEKLSLLSKEEKVKKPIQYLIDKKKDD